MDLDFSPRDEAFRQEVRDFLEDNLPRATRQWSQVMPSYVPKADSLRWQKILGARGWLAANWPAEHGGPGWTVTQRFIFDEEYARIGAPRVSPFGVGMVGPVIYTFGTPEQKARYLPAILAGEVTWCQGYSEPGAGSDLASLQTRALRDGDDYIVKGHKIWTSGAHHADMMFCLVRTDSAAKPQEGISFLLIDMKTPGITVKPIVSIDLNHYLNEVFLDDVRVPAANRIGEDGRGWTCAKFLLGHERTGIAGVAKSKQKLKRLRAIAAAERDDGASLADDAAFQDRIADIEVALAALDITNLRTLAAVSRGRGPGPESSLLKIKGTEIEQALNELLIEALAYYADPYTPASLRADGNEAPIGPDHVTGVMAEHLLRRAATIYGGSNEIQRNIIAKHVLEL